MCLKSTKLQKYCSCTNVKSCAEARLLPFAEWAGFISMQLIITKVYWLLATLHSPSFWTTSGNGIFFGQTMLYTYKQTHLMPSINWNNVSDILRAHRFGIIIGKASTSKAEGSEFDFRFQFFFKFCNNFSVIFSKLYC